MKPEIKAAWVEALRSGEFEQGQSAMYNPDAECHCCLGVLARLYCRDTGKDFDEYLNQSGNETPAQTTEFQAWLGDIDGFGAGYNPDVVIDYGDDFVPRISRHSVAEHNDEGATFAMLADAIEAQL